MATKTKEVGIRLSVKDADIAKRALATFGTEGQAALKRIEASGKPAAVSVQALNAAMGTGKTAFTGFVTGAERDATDPLRVRAFRVGQAG